jgi:geranylgeranyl pyrophosphate synthase
LNVISLKRRGEPCSHIKFGVDVAVNTGNFMYFSPMARIHEFIPKEHLTTIYRIILEEMTLIHFGK